MPITEDELYAKIIKRKPELAKFDKQIVLAKVYARKPELKGMVTSAPPATDFSVSTGATGTISGINPTSISPIVKDANIRETAMKGAQMLPAVAATTTSALATPLPIPARAGIVGLAAGAGEAGRQLATRALGGISPSTSGEAAKKIGTAVGGAAALETVGSAAFAAGGKVLSKVMPPISDFIAKKLPERLVNSIIKPRLRDFIYGKNPGAGVVDEGIIATSFDDLAKKITSKKDEIGKMYDPLLKKYAAKKVDLSNTLKPIDDVIEQASKYKNVNASAIARLEDTRNDLIQNLVNKDVTGKWALSPAQALELKREVGSITKFTGNESDDKMVNSAMKKVYHYIDSKLDSTIPGIRRLNERWANMMGAEQAIKYRAQLMERQNVMHMPELLTGGAVGLGTGAPVIGVGAALAHKALGSTLVKTTTAKALSKSPILGAQIKAATKLGIPVSQFIAMSKITPEQKK